MGELLAQQAAGEGMGTGAIAAIVGSIGVPAILAWFLWYRTAVLDPKQAEENRKCHENIANKFSDTVGEVVDKFDTRLANMMDRFQCKGRDKP